MTRPHVKKIFVALLVCLTVAAFVLPTLTFAQEDPPANPAPAPGGFVFTNPNEPPPTSGGGSVGIAGTDVTKQCEKWNIYCHFVVGFRALVVSLLGIIQRLFGSLLELFVFGTIELMKFGIKALTFPLVKSGVATTLDIANLLFVLAIIVIAIATILRIESYNTKKLLRNLIIAALLVNFSLLIAGTILDLTHILAANFIDSPEFANQIGALASPQKIVTDILGVQQADYEIPGGTIRANNSGELLLGVNIGGEGWILFGNIVLGMLLSIILTAVLAAAMFAVMLTTLIRSLWVIALVILMPLVWGLWTIPHPKFQDYWKKWWENFLKWAFILPTMAFFVSLAANLGNLQNEYQTTLGGPTPKTPGALGGLLNSMIMVLLAAGFLVAAVKMAKATGIVGAGLAMGGAAWLGKKTGLLAGRGAAGLTTGVVGAAGGAVVGALRGGAKGAKETGVKRWSAPFTGIFAGAGSGFKNFLGAKRAGKRAGKAAAQFGADILTKRPLSDEELAKKTEEEGGLTHGRVAKEAFGTAMSLIPGTGRLGNKLAGYAKSDEEVKNWRKENVSNLTAEQFKSLLKAPPPQGFDSDTAKAGILSEAASRHMIDQVGHDNARIFAAAVRAKNPGTAPKDISELKELVKHSPSLAPEVLGVSESEFRNKMSASEIAALDPDDIIANALKHSPSQLAGAAGKSKEVEEAVYLGVARAFTRGKGMEVFKDVGKEIDELEGLQGRINTARNTVKRSKSPTDAADLDALLGQRTVLVRAVAGHARKVSKDKKALEKLDDEQRIAVDVVGRLSRNIGTMPSAGGGGPAPAEPPATH